MFCRCSKCDSEKPAAEFHKDASRPNGLAGWCKSCWHEHGLSKKIQVPCKACNALFFRKTSQSYCTLTCALWGRIEKRAEDECWPWLNSQDAGGYGIFSFGGKKYKATREVVAEREACPASLYVLHSCDNPVCCNPRHLRLGTPKENSKDRSDRNRVNAPKGVNHFRAQLSTAQVVEIKSLLGKVRQIDLAEKFGVTRSSIADISAGRKWKGI